MSNDHVYVSVHQKNRKYNKLEVIFLETYCFLLVLVAFNDFYFKHSAMESYMITHARLLALPNINYSFKKSKKK